MAVRKGVPDDFDEQEFIAQFKSRPKVAAVVPEPSAPQIEVVSDNGPPKTSISKEGKKESRSRKSRKDEYLSTFFELKDNLSPRLGKTITIRPDYHKKIQQIVNVIADEEITIFNYLDNVLTHHFATYERDIVDLYNNRSPFEQPTK